MKRNKKRNTYGLEMKVYSLFIVNVVLKGSI